MHHRRKRTLTYRLLAAYMLIALLPIAMLVSVTAYAFQRQQVDMIIRASDSELDDSVIRIESIFESMASLETAFRMRSDLVDMLTSPDTDWQDFRTISFFIDELDEVQRELFLVPEIGTMHLFIYDEDVPERWPLILHASRLGDTPPAWDYGWKDVIADDFQDTVYLAKSGVESHYGRPYGILQTCVDLRTLLPEIFSTGDDGHQHDYAFHVSDGRIDRIGSSGNRDSIPVSLLEEAAGMALERGDERGAIRLSGGLRFYDILYYHAATPSLLLIKVCPTEEIAATYFLYALGAVAIIILIMAFILFLSWRMTKRHTRTLIGIMDAMEEVAKGNFNAALPESEMNARDVEEARSAFVALTGQLRDALQAIKEQEQLLADTQIRAMQNQINVHFLINTVESIKMQAMINGDDSVEHSLDLLGELFRYSLRWKERFVPLSDELGYIDTYIELMNFRNDFNVAYHNEVDPAWYGIVVPKMLLQPFVENAFKHSFDIIGSDGNITICSEDGGDRVYLIVTNDGVVFDEDKRVATLEYLRKDVPEKSSGSSSIGIKNTQQRLFMFYGDDYSIMIRKDEQMRTQVIIPVRKGGSVYEDLDSR